MRPYGYSGLLTSLTSVMAVFLVGCALCFCLVATCTAPEVERPQSQTVIDTSDADLMHSLGMPTKSELAGYHIFGRWGYYRDGEFVLHESIPGDCEAWDELYGLDPDSPNYRYPKEA